MDSLLPPSASDFERDIEQVVRERLALIDRNISFLWGADTCPADWLKVLAWTYSVDVWSDDWPEHIKRSVIKNSVSLHRIKGTRRAVENAVQSMGGNIVITEWWEQNPQGVPGTFEVTIIYGGSNVTQQLQIDIISQINEVKRESAHYTLQTGIALEGELNYGGRAVVTQFVQLEFTNA